MTLWGLKTCAPRTTDLEVKTMLAVLCVCMCVSHDGSLFLQRQDRPLIAILLRLGFRAAVRRRAIAPHRSENLFYFHPQGISAAILSKCKRDGGFIPVNKNLW